MTRYREEAEALYQRVERKIGKPPKQQDIKDYLGRFYYDTKAQNEFITMAVSLRKVGTYTRTHQPWNRNDEQFLLENPVEVAYETLKSRHTRQAIMKKRQRLLKANK